MVALVTVVYHVTMVYGHLDTDVLMPTNGQFVAGQSVDAWRLVFDH